MQTIARLAVLLSCAAAGGTLLVALAGPRSAVTFAREAHPGSLPGVLPAALAGYVLLVATAVLAGFVAAPPGERIPMTARGLVIVLWAGGALALVSWLLAIGAVVVALVGGVHIERHR